MQHLDASSLLPTTSASELRCTCPPCPPGPPGPPGYCSVATAAILPPPPSFLCPDLGQVKTVALNKHPASHDSSSATPSFLTLPRNGRKGGAGKVYDGAGPRTSADGFSGSHPSGPLDDLPLPLPPPAMFCEDNTKFVNFGCAECEGQAEHQRIKSLLKQKKGKGGRSTKLTENRESGNQEVWTKSSYSTLPNPRIRGYSAGARAEQGAAQQPGSQV